MRIYVMYIYIYTWNLFVLYFGASTLQKKAVSNQNGGHFGSRYILNRKINLIHNTNHCSQKKMLHVFLMCKRFIIRKIVKKNLLLIQVNKSAFPKIPTLQISPKIPCFFQFTSSPVSKRTGSTSFPVSDTVARRVAPCHTLPPTERWFKVQGSRSARFRPKVWGYGNSENKKKLGSVAKSNHNCLCKNMAKMT